MSKRRKFIMMKQIHKPDELGEMLKESCQEIPIAVKRRYDKSSIGYLDMPCAFDTETTSFIDDSGEESATMYAWAIGINGSVMIGRTWEELTTVFNSLVNRFRLSDEKRMVFYVHNLGFDFQFMRKWFTWSDVFAIKPLTPIYAVTDNGLEFRDSYILSALSLAKTGENLQKYKVKKMVGDLDYKKYRHCKTPLTDAEIGYIANDVRVVMAYIQECIEDDGSIAKIPLTNTGRVRRYCRNACFNGGRYKKADYMKLINKLTLSPADYLQLRNAFQGGFTHANPFMVGKELENIASYDLTSAYPTTMIAEKFPMSAPIPVHDLDAQKFEESIKYYCCLFDCRFKNLRPKLFFENYLSKSKCRNGVNVVTTNGRVITAESLETTLTEQDYFIMDAFYTWDKMEVWNMKRFYKWYLPKDFVKAILDLYKAKTELKGIDGMEAEYLKSKGMLNSTYGMAVTSILRDEISYQSNNWKIDHANINAVMDKYNTDKNRFLYFPWGVWVTAYNRRNIFMAIKSCGNDYVYSDTDSVKILNAKKHEAFFVGYNDWIIARLKKALDYYGFEHDLIMPKTKDEKVKPLGVFDFEGIYTRFKTLGAKRYMVEKDGEINITVSGLNKKVAVPYILNHSENPFEFFSDEMVIPKGYTGKNIHKYLDYEQRGKIIDYLGNENEYYEKSSVYMTESEYHLSMSENMVDEFVNFVSNLLSGYYEWRK